MNLIDFHVTKVLGPPIRKDFDWGTVWHVQVEYWDDGGAGQTKTMDFSSDIEAKAVKPGYVGQH